MYRIARLVVLVVVCVLMAVVPVLVIIFWPVIGEWVGAPRRRGPQPGVVVRKAAPVVQAAPELPPGPPRKGRRTWRAVEAEFDKARAERGEHPAWKDNPSATYAVVANPAFTDSESLLDHSLVLAQWRREIPDSPTPLIAMARAQIDWAWQARGYGPAESISEEDWRQFFSRIAEARELLVQALALGVKDGEAYRLLIQVGLAEERPYEEVRAVLDEGRKLDPTYFPLYTQFGRYLLPRWQGKRGDVERFAAEMAEALPGDDGLEAYARIALNIHQIYAERDLIYFGEYDRGLLVKSAELLMQRRDGDREEANFAAQCAWVARDREAALRLREKMGEEMQRDPIWVSYQHRREFDFWCRLDEFAATDDARWFWGSMFYGENVVFWKDSAAVWCGGGYGPAAMNLVDIDRGRIRMSLPSQAAVIERFAVDANKEWVAVGLRDELYQKPGYRAVKVWRLDDPTKPLTFEITDPCLAIAIHPVEPQVAWAFGNTIHSIHVETGERKVLLKADDLVRRMRYSADGKWLVVSTERESIWDAATGELRQEMPHTRMRPIPKPWCEKVLGIDEERRIWAIVEQIEPGKRTMSLVRYAADGKSFEPVKLEEPFTCDLADRAVLSGDFRLLAVNRIRPSKSTPGIEIDVWDVETGKKIKHFGGHHSGLMAMSFSPDGKWLATMGFPTGLVKVWSLEEELK